MAAEGMEAEEHTARLKAPTNACSLHLLISSMPLYAKATSPSAVVGGAEISSLLSYGQKRVW